MNPAMIAVWLLGLTLIWFDATQQRWGWRVSADALDADQAGRGAFPDLVASLSGGGAQALRRRPARRASERFWRMTNELPFLVAIVMVLAITTKFAVLSQRAALDLARRLVVPLVAEARRRSTGASAPPPLHRTAASNWR